MITPYRLITAHHAVLCLALSFASLAHASSSKVASSVQLSSGFEDDTIAPFSVCTTKAPNYVQPTTFAGSKCLKYFWTQVGYDGTRMKKGTETCGGFQTFKEGWYGFLFYLPSAGYPKNKEGAIAQIFQKGACNSWAAKLVVRQGALYIDYRGYCGIPVQALITSSIQYDAWKPILIHFVTSHQKAATIEVWYAGALANSTTPTYRATGINFGFGVWNADDSLAAGNQIELKLGMYNYDDAHYTAGETRTVYYDNVCQLVGHPANAFSIASPVSVPPVENVVPSELAVISGGAVVEKRNAGFHGTGYVNFPLNGGSLTFNNINGGAGGIKMLAIRYALGTPAARTGQLIINGAPRSITFTPTGAWTIWTTVYVSINLQPGSSNSIEFRSVGTDLANIDEIVLP